MDDMTSGLKSNSRSMHKAATHAAQWKYLDGNKINYFTSGHVREVKV